MHPQAVHLLAGAYVVDGLAPGELLDFESHLAGCRDCRDEVASLRAAAVLLADTVASSPPPLLRRRVIREVSRVRPLPPLPATGAAAPPVRRTRRRAWALAVAAGLIAVVGTGVAVDVVSDPADQVSASSLVLHAADSKHSTIESRRGWTATVWHSDSVGRAVLVTTDLPAPPDGLVYQAWLDQPISGRVSAGLLPSRPDQTVALQGDAATAKAAAITLEPAGGSSSPTSDPIAVFDFGPSA